jgi:serine/threonine protein kinase
MGMLREGDWIGAYKIGPALGGGGMGEVYRAVKVGPHGFRREVALKVVAAGRSGDAEHLSMLQAEARLAAQLHHANVAGVLDYGVRDDGMPWLVQELVEGSDLARVCRRTPLPLQLGLYITGEILRGLKYAHEHPLRVVHRDIKPSNVLVGHEGAVKITDFGVACAAGETSDRLASPKGSPAYMAPECCLDLREPTTRSDLFAVGLVLWEMLTGRPLCAQSDSRVRIYRGELPPLAERLPAAVDRFLRWLLAPDPRHRCPTAEEGLRALALVPEARLAGARELEAFLCALALGACPAAPIAFERTRTAATRA